MKIKRASRPTSPASSQFIKRPKVRADHYGSTDHAAWSRTVLASSGGSCQRCGATSAKLYADHIEEIKDNPARALDVTNGQALCASCHGLKTHEARIARLTARH